MTDIPTITVPARAGTDQWPDGIKTRDGDYNLTWQQGPPQPRQTRQAHPIPQTEVVVFAREPHAEGDTAVFIDGRPTDPQRPAVVVTTYAVYLDTDDEENWWMAKALRGIGHQPLLAIAATRVTDAQAWALSAYVTEQIYVARFQRR